ncbi:MAG: DNA primase [Chloroflexota bacterium]
MSAIDEVKQRADIVEVIGQYAKLTKAGKNFRSLCPFHAEKAPSFYVNPERQTWHCFGACNTGGDVISFLMKKEGLTFGEALESLARKVGVTLPPRPGTAEKAEVRESRYQVNEAAAQYFHNLLVNSPAAAAARKYIEKRGFSEETARNFQLGYSLNSWDSLKNYLVEKGHAEELIAEVGLLVTADDGTTHDRFRNKLIFPIFDTRGHVTGFGARVMDDSLPKYVNSPQSMVFDKSATLYALNFAGGAIRQQDQVVIVEGYVDVITAHQHGFTNVIASMGTSITETQVRTLKKYSRNVILALDADTAGEEAMLRSLQYENLLEGEIRVLVMPEGQDPDDVIKKDKTAWPKLLQEAVPIVDYTLNQIASRVDLKTTSGKSTFAKTLGPIILGVRDKTRQAEYLEKFGKNLNVDPHTAETILRASGTQPIRTNYRVSRENKIDRVVRQVTTAPREELCLTLLLQYPELRAAGAELDPEYFQSSENREVLRAWQRNPDVTALGESLEPALREHLERLRNRESPGGQVQSKFDDVVARLRLDFYRRMAEGSGAGGDEAVRTAQGIEASEQIREIFRKNLSKVIRKR